MGKMENANPVLTVAARARRYFHSRLISKKSCNLLRASGFVGRDVITGDANDYGLHP
jgi:hypothetical protein